MDINDLHDLRDGTSPRRHRTFNPFIHLSPDAPLMRLLFTITRPGGVRDPKPVNKLVVSKKVVRAAKRPSRAISQPSGSVPLPSASMVSWKERKP